MSKLGDVARGIARVDFTDPFVFPWDECPEEMQEVYLRQATAAITALREPTEEMLEILRENGGIGGWEMMIDWILKQGDYK